MKRKIFYPAAAVDQGLLQNFPGDVFSETDGRMIPRRIRRRMTYPAPIECELGLPVPTDMFSETHENPTLQRVRHRHAYPNPVESEQGLPLPGDDFAETHELPTSWRRRHRRIDPPPVECELGLPLAGDVFSDTDARMMPKRARNRRSYPQPIECELGLLQNFKGDVFSDPVSISSASIVTALGSTASASVSRATVEPNGCGSRPERTRVTRVMSSHSRRPM
jgi:hypothetical protein